MARTLEPGRLPPHLRWALIQNMNRILLADDGRDYEAREGDAHRIAIGFLRFIQTPAGDHLDQQIMRAFQMREELPRELCGRTH